MPCLLFTVSLWDHGRCHPPHSDFPSLFSSPALPFDSHLILSRAYCLPVRAAAQERTGLCRGWPCCSWAWRWKGTEWLSPASRTAHCWPGPSLCTWRWRTGRGAWFGAIAPADASWFSTGPRTLPAKAVLGPSQIHSTAYIFKGLINITFIATIIWKD